MTNDQSTVSTEPVKLTNWAKPPSIRELKQDLLDAKNSHDAHMGKVNTWLDNLHVRGAALVKANANGSKIAVFEQVGTLAATNANINVNISRTTTLGIYDMTGAMLNIHDNTASTGNLLTVTKQSVDKFVILNSGNVGVGITTPTAKMHVVGNFIVGQGADVASVNGAMTLGTDGNLFEITGTNSITLISNVGWVNGSEVTLMFTSTATLVNGTASSGTNITMKLAGAVDFVASADDVITLVLGEIGGTQAWREKCRSVN